MLLSGVFGATGFFTRPTCWVGIYFALGFRRLNSLEKSMPGGWVGFFSLPGLFSMCGLTRGQPANVASRATPNFAQFICLNPRAPISTGDRGGWQRPRDGCIPSADDDTDHPPKHLPGVSAGGSPVEGEPHILHCAGATIWDRQQRTPPGAFPNRQQH